MLSSFLQPKEGVIKVYRLNGNPDNNNDTLEEEAKILTFMTKENIRHVPKILEKADSMILLSPVAKEYHNDIKRVHIHQTVNCLEAMHQRGWVHRDIRPENLLRVSDQEVLVNDWGYATCRKEAVIYRGTFHFASDAVLEDLEKKAPHLSKPEVCVFKPR